MDEIVEQLEAMAKELEKEDERMVREIRKGGEQSRDGFERVLRAIHRLHHLAGQSAAKLRHVAQDLKQK